MKKYHDEDWLRDKYWSEELSTYDIADLCGCTYQTIFRWMKKYDIPRRDIRKHHFNMEKFKSIDIPSKAYWLGFLIADGSVDNHGDIYIGLSKKDRDHLVKFRDFLEFKDSPYKIHSYHDSMVRFTVNSVDMVDDLAEYGIVPNKVDKTYLPDVKHRYMDHLIRGIFDGDGAIYTYNGYPRWNITGTKKLVKSIKEHIDTVLDCSITGPHGESYNTYKIHKDSISGVKEILHYLYNNSTEKTRLTRKRKTANQIYKLKYSY